jgi:hypothetical protein
LRGFQLSQILRVNSGRPYNLLAGVELNNNGDGGLGDRPLVGGVSLGRNVGIAPGFANLDLRIMKTVPIKDRVEIKAIVEVFNLFNRVNINPDEIDRVFLPDAQLNFQLPPKSNGRYIVTPDRYRGAFAPREFQLGLRLSF